MGTTLAALQSGSVAYRYVVAIEGCKYLLHNSTDAAVLAAWAGTDWADDGDFIGGLFVDLQCEQRLNPNEPFGSGGSCTLTVVPDVDDVFGKFTGKRHSSARTYLTQSLDCDDTT